MMARLTSALLAVGLFMFTVLSVAAVAGSYVIELPYLIVGGPSERVVFDGPVDGAGEVCGLVFTAGNNISPHNTDLRFESNGQTVTLFDVERESFAVTTGAATIIHDGWATITRVVHDEFSSLSGVLELQCLPVTTTTTTTTPPSTTVPPGTTTSTIPPTTSTTSTTTTVTTVPPSTTTTSTPPTSTSTTTTVSTTTTTSTSTSTTAPPTTSTTSPPPECCLELGGGGTANQQDQSPVGFVGFAGLVGGLVWLARRELA